MITLFIVLFCLSILFGIVVIVVLCFIVNLNLVVVLTFGLDLLFA